MLELPGKLLRNKREELGLALADVSKSTLIRLNILHALETDDTETFSSIAQYKGFLRNYARFLKLDLQEEIKDPLSKSSTIEIIPEPDPQAPSTNQNLGEVDKTSQNQSISPTEIATENTIEDPDEPIKIPHSDTIESHEIFLRIGRILNERRSLLSFSLVNVSQIIHIKESYLEALEIGDLGRFSSPIQFKGALQNYAQYLGIDTTRLLLLFAEGLQKQRKEQNEQETGQKITAKKIHPFLLQLYKFFTLDLLFGVVLIVGILAFLIWGTSRMIQTSQLSNDIPTLPAVADILNATSDNLPNKELVQTSELVTTQEPEIQVTNTLILPLDVYNSPIQVLIIFNQSVWIRVIGDGKNVFEGRIEVGDAQTYTAEQTLYLTIANAAGVQVYFKGEDLGAIGPLGKVVTLAFDNNGLIKAEPTPTSLPTPTLQITPLPNQLTPTNSP